MPADIHILSFDDLLVNEIPLWITGGDAQKLLCGQELFLTFTTGTGKIDSV